MSGPSKSFAGGNPMQSQSIYAEPRSVTDLQSCHFYHTIDIPGYGLIEGDWDLRRGVDRYLGGVDFTQKRVLEMGTANGFLCFEMERRGADVVAVDLSEEQSWDIVPYAKSDTEATDATRKAHMRTINNAYWLGHSAFGSRAKVVYTSAYSVPEQIGAVDVSTFGAILLHLRDPFLALWNALRLTKDTVIVTERLVRGDMFPLSVRNAFQRPAMRLLPNPKTGQPYESWWSLTPALVQRFIGVLGFEASTVTYHRQLYRGRPARLYTVVGRRTAGRTLDAK